MAVFPPISGGQLADTDDPGGKWQKRRPEGQAGNRAGLSWTFTCASVR